MDFVTLRPGDIINQRYELLEKLGSGAFGAVFKARQLGIDRTVAIKLLAPEAADMDGTAAARFTREAKLSSALEHPNTITIHDYGTAEGGVAYLVMEYVRGVSLQYLLRQEVRLSPARAVKIVRQILMSLHEAHARAIVHRDMKPGNIMLFDRVGEKDVVKVLDFGIAKFVSNDNEGMGSEAVQQDLTVAGRIVGTPRYMAPEQINGDGAYPSSDLYALGLIFYEMIAGRQAVTGASTLSLIAVQISSEDVIHHDDPFIPEALRPIIRKATYKSTESRYKSAQEFLNDIEALDMNALAALKPLENRPGWDEPGAPISGEVHTPPPVVKTGGNTAMRWGLAAAVVLVLCVGAVIGVTTMLAETPSANGSTGEPTAEVDPTPTDEEAPPADDTEAKPAVAEPVDDAAAKKPEGETPAPAAAEEDVKEVASSRKIIIESAPAGAEVKLGESLLGKTPLTVSINPAEENSFVIRLDDHKTELLSIDAGSDQTVFSLKLKGNEQAIVEEIAAKPAKKPNKKPNKKADKKPNKKSEKKTPPPAEKPKTGPYKPF